MGLHRTCDLCKTEIRIPGYDPADYHTVPSFEVKAPGGWNFSCDACLPCITKVVKAIAERFPNESASPALHEGAREFLNGLVKVAKSSEDWALKHSKTKEFGIGSAGGEK